MASVEDVAAYVVKKLGALSAMKLQKLVYYCQAWHLAWHGKPMFRARIEAWTQGPVVRKLYTRHRGEYLVTEQMIGGDPAALDENERKTVDSVLAFYGDKSPVYLSELTHWELPWKNARTGLPDDAACDREISLESMESYYSRLGRMN